MRLREDRSFEFMTRTHGEHVRERIWEFIKAAESEDSVVIDFEGIDAMTPSFADECFGKLVERMGRDAFKEKVRLIGAAETIRILINTVMARRLSQLNT